MKAVKFVAVLICFALFSCKVAPKKINYGQEHCAYCDMTVVDQTHASEYVTKKGKSYIFDSIECMTQKILEANNENTLAYILIANYIKPGQLIDARKAVFLVSKQIQSPMGGNLSAFANLEEAKKTQTQFGGKILNWAQLKDKYKN